MWAPQVPHGGLPALRIHEVELTRRIIFAMPLIAFAQPDTPRNRLAAAGNEFQAGFDRWATAMNAKPGTVNMAAVEAFEPLGGLWRKVEHLWREWLRV